MGVRNLTKHPHTMFGWKSQRRRHMAEIRSGSGSAKVPGAGAVARPILGSRILTKLAAAKSQEVCIHCQEVKAVWFVCAGVGKEEPSDVLCEVGGPLLLLSLLASLFV